MNPPDLALIRKAIGLAIQGRGFVEPNPTVGCIITQDNQVIGQGFHPRFGAPHAEPVALSSCVSSPENSTVYVTLEPCCHTGKKTPPCAPALIKAKVARVVIGCLDPNPQVSGQGARQLRDAGIQVQVLDDPACKQLIAPFYAKTVLKRPYVTLKWAVTRDGAMAGPGGRRICITNPTSNARTHRLRARSGAILVGVKTVNNDDPQLTARIPGEARQPLRCVLDPFLQIKPNSKILTDGLGAILFHLPGQHREFPAGVRCIAIEPDALNPSHVNLRKVLGHISMVENVTHLLVEPGPGLIQAFIGANCVDRVWRYTGRGDYSNQDVPRAPGVGFPRASSAALEGDLLEEFLNPHSDAFFALEPSADMLLESHYED